MLYEKSDYTADISYLNNIFIREYDISKCNINVLFTKGVIDKETYDYLYSSERMIRQVHVGKLQRDAKISKILREGINESKKLFLETNNILDHEVLSIKNDAVFIINKIPSVTKFGLIDFKNKNTYTGFYKIGMLELYYYYNSVTKEEKLDIKGIRDDKLYLHKDFIQFLKDLFYLIQMNGPESAIAMLKDFYNDYISLKLPVGYYRAFNSGSEYHLLAQSYTGNNIVLDSIDESNKSILNINHNLLIMNQLQKYLINMIN